MTIPKTSNRAKSIIAAAEHIRVYSLSNCFKAEPLSENPVIWDDTSRDEQGRATRTKQVTQSEFLMHELFAMRSTKLCADSAAYAGQGGHFSIQVHSNLWYEFEIQWEHAA